jgi:hypothetical protein
MWFTGEMLFFENTDLNNVSGILFTGKIFLSSSCLLLVSTILLSPTFIPIGSLSKFNHDYSESIIE